MKKGNVSSCIKEGKISLEGRAFDFACRSHQGSPEDPVVAGQNGVSRCFAEVSSRNLQFVAFSMHFLRPRLTSQLLTMDGSFPVISCDFQIWTSDPDS